MREIPSLRILCLRAVGPPSCDPEVTFGGPRARRVAESSDSDNDDDKSSKQLESSKDTKKSINSEESNVNEDDNDDDTSSGVPLQKPTITSRLLRSLRNSTLPAQPYRGPGRPNANDVDISHPWIMAVYPPRETVNNAPLRSSGTDETITIEAATDKSEAEEAAGAKSTSSTTTTTMDNDEFLTIEHANGNRAIECLQLFIDALVESGRAGDNRMGVHFFREWVVAISGQEPSIVIPRKKKRGDGSSRSSKKRKITLVNDSLPLGSLSLHNFAAGSLRTFRSMERANVGSCLGTLDISGVHGLTDSILTNVVCSGSFPRLRRLSVKNCRKLTGKGIASLGKLTRLCAFDVGGCFNVHPNDVVSMVQNHPSTKRGKLNEIYASGLGWTDVALEEIVDATAGHLRGLGVGFSPYISGPGLILTLSKVATTLDRLAVPFCPGMDDAAASALGRKLPKLAVLDIRGCNKVYSLSGMMEGRAVSATGGGGGGEATNASAQHLFVLARYSGVSNNSLEETMRLYNSEALTCIIDGGGVGGGIRR